MKQKKSDRALEEQDVVHVDEKIFMVESQIPTDKDHVIKEMPFGQIMWIKLQVLWCYFRRKVWPQVYRQVLAFISKPRLVNYALIIGMVWFTYHQLSKIRLSVQSPILISWDDNSHVASAKTVKSVESILPGIDKENPLLNYENDAVLAYVKRYGHLAKQESEKYGIPASIKMGQAIIESNTGQSKLATNNNNHFGIKCFSRKCRKGHCSNFSDDTHKDFFRRYDSVWASWRDHSNLLAKGKYKQLTEYGNDYEAWAQGLKDLGYATDPQYAEKLTALIKKYQLYKLDQ